jgi:hypothetical protein
LFYFFYAVETPSKAGETFITLLNNCCYFCRNLQSTSISGFCKGKTFLDLYDYCYSGTSISDFAAERKRIIDKIKEKGEWISERFFKNFSNFWQNPIELEILSCQ